MTEADVIIVGAGPAGENVAGRVAAGGLSCVVVESHLAGGECSYYACMPSKALLRPMELADEVGRLPGLELGPVDVAKVLARRDEVIAHLDDSSQVEWITKQPATFVRGSGRVSGEREVEVTAPDGSVTTVRARRAVVLATGSVPVLPPIKGLAEARPWGSREATTVKEVPARLIVLGGGVVACEMAQALHALGAGHTTMIVRGGRLLERNEPFAGELLAESMRGKGIELLFGAEASEVSRAADGTVRVTLKDGRTLEADKLLVATGRKPASHDGRPIEVDESLRVPGSDWLYAVGDVNGRNLLTHMGKYQARICGDAIVARARGQEPSVLDEADKYGAPQVVFTDPQVCAVGRTEEAARAEGFDVRVVEYDLGQVSGAHLLGDGYQGRAKAVVDEGRKVLLGVTFAGPGVAELLHAATIAVTAEVPLERLWHAVPAYPTVSEIWLRLLEEYGL
ncbi:dihydrolipoyl dehydrogenase family protein [Nonomuraea sp. NPDC050328]|uniref:dihydrolipoyl dehydrogenase family protein n=1 Tax=Nonomuraea sp. NPDC050328 TaxID=3364361 RepID=UPI0037B6A8BB